MVLLIFGAPGSGKGTQAKKLADWLKVPQLSTGEMLRAEVALGTPLGKKVSQILASGALVSDAVINPIVEMRVKQPDCARGFILDGYPRTVEQALFLDALMARNGSPSPKAVYLDVPVDALVARITARRQCPRCLRIYNLVSQPPVRPGLCDDHNVELVTRADDREDVLRARLAAYQSATAPVLTHYAGPSYVAVDGGRSPDEIFRDVRAKIEKT